MNKALLLSVFLAFTINQVCYSQSDYDSLIQKVLRMDAAINNIHTNMKAHHAQFKTGTGMLLAGVGITVIGTALTTQNEDRLPIVYVGAAFTLIGGIIQMDSHKWLGRGAWKRESLYD